MALTADSVTYAWSGRAKGEVRDGERTSRFERWGENVTFRETCQAWCPFLRKRRMEIKTSELLGLRPEKRAEEFWTLVNVKTRSLGKAFGLLQRWGISFVRNKLYGPHKKQRSSEDKENQQILYFKTKLTFILFKDLVRTAQWTHFFTFDSSARGMLCRKMTAVCSEIHTQCGREISFSNGELQSA
jgi:hypothetical protein